MTPSMIELMVGIRDGLFGIQMFFIQMYRPSERGGEELARSALSISRSHKEEPTVGALVVTMHFTWTVFGSSNRCVWCACGHLVPLELDTHGYRYYKVCYWSGTVDIPHRGYQHP